MNLGETDPVKLRIPLTILDQYGAIATGFVPGAGELVTSKGAALAAAAGTLVEVGSGLYYYQGVAADANTEGFLAVAINRATYRGFSFRPVVGGTGVLAFPFFVTNGGLLATGCNPSGAGELQVSLDGNTFADKSITAFSELGLGYYAYRHDVLNVDTPVIVKVVKAGYDEALAWGSVDLLSTERPVITPSSSVAPTPTIIDVGDIMLTWSNDTGDADMTLLGTDIEPEQTLLTALLLSWFVDRRAENDDVPPSGDPNDRRGWWADEFSEVAGDRWGSRLWLLARSTLTNQTALKAKEYLVEASSWLIEDRVASAVNITTAAVGDALLIAAEVVRPGRGNASFRFSYVWDQLQQQLEAA